jgi:hypothetical protein
MYLYLLLLDNIIIIIIINGYTAFLLGFGRFLNFLIHSP